MNNLVLANSGMNKDAILGWCVYAGPQIDALLDWLEALPSKRRFPLVMQRLMMGGVWLVDVIEDLSGEDVLKALRSVMLRSLA